MNTTFDTIYKDYPVKPYISPNRDMEDWLLNPKTVPKWNKNLLTKLSKPNPMHCFKEFFSCLTSEVFN